MEAGVPPAAQQIRGRAAEKIGAGQRCGSQRARHLNFGSHLQTSGLRRQTSERRGSRGERFVTMSHEFGLPESFATGFLFLDQIQFQCHETLCDTRYSLSTVNYLSFGPLQPYCLTRFGLNLIFGCFLGGGDRSRNPLQET